MADPWPDDVLEKFLAVRPPATWPAGAWEKALRVVALGGSYEQAAFVAGVSKNALLGFAHRAKVPARPSPIQFGMRAKPPKAVTRNRIIAPKTSKPLPPQIMVRLAAPPPRIESPPLPRPIARPVLAPRDGRGCRYPFGDPGEQSFRFCEDAAVLQGSSYCAEHHARCYTRTPSELQRAAEVARQVAGTPLHRPYVVQRAA